MKSWLKTQRSENEHYGIQSHHFMANRRGKVETVTGFIFLGSKSLQMVTVALKLRHLLFGKKVKVAQSCPTLCNPMDCIVHGILQARILEPFPSPGHLPSPGIKPRFPTLQEESLPAELQGKPKNTVVGSLALL